MAEPVVCWPVEVVGLVARAVVKETREVPELEEGLLVDLELLVEDEVNVARAAVEVAREVGIDALLAGVVDLLVGVGGLLVDLELLADEGLDLIPETEEELCNDVVWFLDDMLSHSSLL